MDKDMLPSSVVNSDLKPEIDEEAGHHAIANAITSFIYFNGTLNAD